MPRAANNPAIGYRFGVEIDGITEGRFTECSGLEAKIDVEEYKEGGVNDFVHRLPGRRSFGTITLKRGLYASTQLWDWLNRTATVDAKNDQIKNFSIVLYDLEGAEYMRWNLIGAFPVKWSAAGFQAADSSVSLETLELTYQEFTMQAS